MKRLDLILAALMCVGAGGMMAEERTGKAGLVVTEPVDYEVRQRDAAGDGRIPVSGKLGNAAAGEVTIDARIDTGAKQGEWKPLAKVAAGEERFRGELDSLA